MSFDITSIEVADTFDVEIKNPTTDEPIVVDGKPLTVTVCGPGSKQFKAAQSVQSNRNMKRLRTKGKIETTPEEDAAATASFLSACTVSFNGFDYKGMAANDRETFRACYLDPKMGWLTEQVNKEMGDWSNFTRAA